MEATLRVWDLLFCSSQGSAVLLQVAFAQIIQHEQALMTQDPYFVIQTQFKDGATRYLDHYSLMSIIQDNMTSHNINKSSIHALRLQVRQNFMK